MIQYVATYVYCMIVGPSCLIISFLLYGSTEVLPKYGTKYRRYVVRNEVWNYEELPYECNVVRCTVRVHVRVGLV
jgi:hypothetical protein